MANTILQSMQYYILYDFKVDMFSTFTGDMAMQDFQSESGASSAFKARSPFSSAAIKGRRPS
jgi:hypothetical protein